jgi:hypothetical protein
MRFSVWGILALVIAIAAASRGHDEKEFGKPAGDAHGDAFIYDTAARFNERLAANIDAIDTSLTAIIAGDVAVLIFAIDKLTEFHPLATWSAIVLLSASILVCAVGYVLGLHKADEGDGLRPERVVQDLATNPKKAMVQAIADMVLATEVNYSTRLAKRTAMVIAIVFLCTAAIVVALDRFDIGMVS